MTQNNEQDGKLTLRRPGRLELKKTVETGQVRQSFSHGRTKAVTVEVKKKRTFERSVGGNMRAVTDAPVPTAPEETPAAIQDAGNLTEEERAARMRALRSAAHDEERRQIREAEERQQRKADEAKRKAEEEEAQRKAKEEEARKVAAAAATATEAAPPPKEATGRAKRAEAAPRRTTEAPAAPPRRPGKPEADRPTPRTRNEPRRRDRKLTISQALDEADGTEEERVRSLAARTLQLHPGSMHGRRLFRES